MSPQRGGRWPDCLSIVLTVLILLAVPVIVWIAAGGWWPS